MAFFWLKLALYWVCIGFVFPAAQTAHFGLSHGLACSLPLASLIEYNGKKNFKRISIIADALKAERDLIKMKLKLTGFFKELGIKQKLSEYGIYPEKIQPIITSSLSSERSENNIAVFNDSEIKEIIESMF